MSHGECPVSPVCAYFGLPGFDKITDVRHDHRIVGLLFLRRFIDQSPAFTYTAISIENDESKCSI